MNYNFSQLKAIALQNELDNYNFGFIDGVKNVGRKIGMGLTKAALPVALGAAVLAGPVVGTVAASNQQVKIADNHLNSVRMLNENPQIAQELKGIMDKHDLGKDSDLAMGLFEHGINSAKEIAPDLEHNLKEIRSKPVYKTVKNYVNLYKLNRKYNKAMKNKKKEIAKARSDNKKNLESDLGNLFNKYGNK